MYECMQSSLDIFSGKPFQSNVLQTDQIAYKPLAAIESGGNIEFISYGHGQFYRDLSSILIRLRVQLVKDQKNTLHTDDKCGVINNTLQSMFRQCAIYLNGKPIAQTDTNYNMRSYFESLFSYNREQAEICLRGNCWHLDTPGKMDSCVAGENKGLDARKKRFAKGAIVELIGRVHGDLFNQPKFLLNGVDLRIIFTPEKSDFYIMNDAADDTSFLRILDATLLMNHVTVVPSILLAHEAVLARKNAVYNYKRVEVKSYTIGANAQTLSIDNAIVGPVPRRIILGFLYNENYSGNRKMNPYNFVALDISQLAIILNGSQRPVMPLEYNYTDKDAPQSERAYHALARELNLENAGHQITKEAFDNGFFFASFNLLPDASVAQDDCLHGTTNGIVRIEARFAKPLPKTISVIVYSEFDSALEIDRDRNVYTQF